MSFTRMRRERSHESFYGYALMTPDCVLYNPVMSSKESVGSACCRYLIKGYLVIGQGAKYSETEDQHYIKFSELRYCPSEWGYNMSVAPPESEIWAEMGRMCEQLADASTKDELDTRDVVLDQLGNTMIETMQILDERGMFGSGPEREKVCLWVWVDPWLSTEWCERALIKLNTPSVVAKVKTALPEWFVSE
jgi:Domain of unknown function (DUF4303)